MFIGDALSVKGDKFSKSERVNEANSYTSVVGSLMYAQLCTLLNIVYAVNVLGRF